MTNAWVCGFFFMSPVSYPPFIPFSNFSSEFCGGTLLKYFQRQVHNLNSFQVFSYLIAFLLIQWVTNLHDCIVETDFLLRLLRESRSKVIRNHFDRLPFILLHLKIFQCSIGFWRFQLFECLMGFVLVTLSCFIEIFLHDALLMKSK